MGLLGMILAAVLVAVLIAIVIVKFLPLKLRWIASLMLLALSVFLVVKIWGGIMEPINFNKNKVKKYAKVIENLKIIRDAQVKHFEVTGKYTENKAGLIQFIDTAKLALTETTTIVEKENRGGGIIVDVEKRKTDTIGFEPVSKYFKDKDYKNMFKVPGVEGKEFELNEGDAILYNGVFEKHWRPGVYKGNGMAQVFFHYVDKNGHFPHHGYDNYFKITKNTKPTSIRSYNPN